MIASLLALSPLRAVSPVFIWQPSELQSGWEADVDRGCAAQAQWEFFTWPFPHVSAPGGQCRRNRYCTEVDNISVKLHSTNYTWRQHKFEFHSRFKLKPEKPKGGLCRVKPHAPKLAKEAGVFFVPFAVAKEFRGCNDSKKSDVFWG